MTYLAGLDTAQVQACSALLWARAQHIAQGSMLSLKKDWPWAPELLFCREPQTNPRNLEKTSPKGAMELVVEGVGENAQHTAILSALLSLPDTSMP